jgi:hypothetical protein
VGSCHFDYLAAVYAFLFVVFAAIFGDESKQSVIVFILFPIGLIIVAIEDGHLMHVISQ